MLLSSPRPWEPSFHSFPAKPESGHPAVRSMWPPRSRVVDSLVVNATPYSSRARPPPHVILLGRYHPHRYPEIAGRCPRWVMGLGTGVQAHETLRGGNGARTPAGLSPAGSCRPIGRENVWSAASTF